MAYQLLDNFAYGLDTRKSPLTSPAGTLTRLKNAVITPGGEIQKRRAFVKVANLPANSFGLATTESRLIIFGKNANPAPPVIATPPGIVPPVVTVIGVPNTDPNITQRDFDVFDGKVYLAAYAPAGATSVLKNPHYWDDGAVGGVMALTEGAGKGYYVRTYKSKIYAVSTKYLNFSAANNPMVWLETSPAAGQGQINVSLQDANSETLTSLEIYYSKLAVFSSESTQIWAVASDPDDNAFEQLLRGVGTNAARSPLQYGNGDVLFLDESGVRSLKARDSSNSASVSDIGSPIDSTLQDLRIARGADYMNSAVGLLEPSVGRFWLVFPDQVYALSYFPSPKITAWSQFTLPFTVQHAVTCAGKIYFRDTANQLWVYGGMDGATYDNCGVEARLPYLDGKKPGHRKLFKGFDATVSYQYDKPTETRLTGEWRVAISYDFNDPEQEDTLCTIDRPTWNAGMSEAQGYDSHFSLRFYNDDDKPVTLSNVAVHYDMADDEA